MKKELLLATALAGSLGLAGTANAVTMSMSGHHEVGIEGESPDGTGVDSTARSGGGSGFAISLSETTDGGIGISSGFSLMNESTGFSNSNSGLTLTFTDGSKMDLVGAGNASDSHDVAIPASAGSEAIAYTATNAAPGGIDGLATGGDAVGFEWHSAADAMGVDGMKFSVSGSFNGDATTHTGNSTAVVDTGYAVGVTQADTCGSRNKTGLHIIDLNIPKNPTFAGCYSDPATEVYSLFSAGIGYIHDTQCIIYNGPDDQHKDKELCFSSAEGAIVITDVNNKNNPKTLSTTSHPDMGYSHQGWLTEDHRYFLMNDELDELNFGRNTKTYIWDVSIINEPTFLGYHTHNTNSIDHNLFVRGDYLIQSNYSSGLRVFDLLDVHNAKLNEVAYFDSEPSHNDANWNGSWGNYPYLPSSIILISDIRNGLFIVRPDYLNK